MNLIQLMQEGIGSYLVGQTTKQSQGDLTCDGTITNFLLFLFLSCQPFDLTFDVLNLS